MISPHLRNFSPRNFHLKLTVSKTFLPPLLTPTFAYEFNGFIWPYFQRLKENVVYNDIIHKDYTIENIPYCMETVTLYRNEIGSHENSLKAKILRQL